MVNEPGCGFIIPTHHFEGSLFGLKTFNLPCWYIAGRVSLPEYVAE